MTNKLSTILNWSLPKELESYSQKLVELMDERDDFQEEAELKATILADNTNILQYVNQLIGILMEDQAIEDAIAINITELQARRTRYKKRQERVKDFLKLIMTRYDLKRFDCPNGSVTNVIKQKSKVNVLDENKLLKENPQLFIFPNPVLNKVVLKEALLEGKEINGAELVDSDYIQIRR
jgi:flagellar biosynthesis chaperone FliJ